MKIRLLQQQPFCLQARKLRSFMVLIFVAFSSALFAQNNQEIIVVGRVAAGDTALMGATVNVKGTATSTQTDANGRFTIQAPANGTLVISSVGYDVQEVRINNRASLSINLQSSNRRMEEVEFYYMLQNGQMVLLPASARELPELFGEKKEPIAQFVTSKQLKMQHPEDFVAVVNKYNELLAAQ